MNAPVRPMSFDDAMMPIAKMEFPSPRPMPEHRGCYYMKHLFSSPEFVLERAAGVLRNQLQHIDTFVGIGNSGVAPLMLFAYKFRKTFAIVRKEGVSSHSRHIVEGRVGDTWLFVDDLIASGNTWRRISEAMSKEYPRSICYGAYLYDGQYEGPSFKRHSEIIREFGDWR